MNQREIAKRILGVLSMAFMFGANSAHAKGSPTISVTTTGTATGTVVQGTITITNTTTKSATVTTINDALEVRFPTGFPSPPLPPGFTSGYFLVTTVSLPPPSPIPPLGTVSIPYSIDTCGAQVRNYSGAKDMRAVAVVTSGTQVVQARTANFAAPSQTYCPVCGNGIREGNEQCDGAACCTMTCGFVSNGTACTDGNLCTHTDRCQGGSCIGSDPVTCVAADQCHSAGTCNLTTGACSNPFKANGTACNDGSACSTGDTCANGQCIGSPVICNDDNVCTTDFCSAGECLHTNNSNPCEDGSVCTVGDSCVGGECTGGLPRDCNDHQACTDDLCEEVNACTHTATPTCETCHAEECVVCQQECTNTVTRCRDSCWGVFGTCLDGCTTTYCAPFCQVSLGQCLNACPDQDPCWSACESGNGCGLGCIQPQ